MLCRLFQVSKQDTDGRSDSTANSHVLVQRLDVFRSILTLGCLGRGEGEGGRDRGLDRGSCICSTIKRIPNEPDVRRRRVAPGPFPCLSSASSLLVSTLCLISMRCLFVSCLYSLSCFNYLLLLLSLPPSEDLPTFLFLFLVINEGQMDSHNKSTKPLISSFRGNLPFCVSCLN